MILLPAPFGPYGRKPGTKGGHVGLDESSYARQMGAIKQLMESLPSDWEPDALTDRQSPAGKALPASPACCAESGDGRTERSA